MYRMIEFDSFGDKDSVLVALQRHSNCPFEIKRVFYILNVPQGVARGNHANRESRFLLIALKGSCKVCVDDGFRNVEFILDSAKRGLFLDKMLWKSMYDFSEDCVLLVVSDKYYCKDEYIYDYDEYVKSVGGGGIAMP